MFTVLCSGVRVGTCFTQNGFRTSEAKFHEKCLQQGFEDAVLDDTGCCLAPDPQPSFGFIRRSQGLYSMKQKYNLL